MYVKQVCHMTSERVSASAITHCSSSILHTSIAMAMEHMAKWIKEKWYIIIDYLCECVCVCVWMKLKSVNITLVNYLDPEQSTQTRSRVT